MQHISIAYFIFMKNSLSESYLDVLSSEIMIH